MNKKRYLIMVILFILSFSMFLSFYLLKNSESNDLSSNLAQAEQYKHYYETYNDTYALWHIYDLIDEGKISAEILEGLDQGDWEQIPRPSEAFYAFKMEMMEFEKVMNGRGEDYEGYMFDDAFRSLYDITDRGYLYISAFDTQESRDRFESGIKIINNYFEDPTDENLKKYEEMMFNENNLPGEVLYFDIYFQRAPNAPRSILKDGKSYSIVEYQEVELKEYGTALIDLTNANYLEVIEQNATPNPEDYEPKEWLTAERISELLAEQYSK